tara:strand:+ start:74 stop:322 length:249 start_codon:yes stop_codon:yes gene_type:complete
VRLHLYQRSSANHRSSASALVSQEAEAGYSQEATAFLFEFHKLTSARLEAGVLFCVLKRLIVAIHQAALLGIEGLLLVPLFD